jgi:hypothetical protein
MVTHIQYNVVSSQHVFLKMGIGHVKQYSACTIFVVHYSMYSSCRYITCKIMDYMQNYELYMVPTNLRVNNVAGLYCRMTIHFGCALN